MSDNEAAAQESPIESVPGMNISTSSFSGFGSFGGAAFSQQSEPAQSLKPSGQQPNVAHWLPQSIDNGNPEFGNLFLRAAMKQLGDQPSEAERIDVLRNLLQGYLFVPVQGDAEKLFKLGKDLPLSLINSDQGQLLMVFTGMDALNISLAASGTKQDITALKQPIENVLAILRDSDLAGIVIDGGNEYQSAYFPRELLLAAFDDMDDQLRVRKLALEAPSDSRTEQLLKALADAPLWLAGQQSGPEGQWGVAENRSPDGTSYLELFTHPLEVRARGRNDSPMPIELAQLLELIAQAAHLDGVVIDPAGPSIELRREDFAQLLQGKN